MDQTDVSLDDIELDVMSRLTEVLRGCLSLVVRAFNLTAKALEMERRLPSPSDIASSRLVTTHLLGRVSNDLRGIAMLAERGYAMQAASLAACAFESGFAVVYIGGDDKIADSWLEHRDSKPWRNVLELIQGTLVKLSPSNEEDFQPKARQLYDAVYRPVAAAKHSNPNMQRLHLRAPHSFVSGNGPIESRTSVEIAEHSLLTAVYANIMALYGYASNHLAIEHGVPLLKSVRELELDYEKAVKTHNEGSQDGTLAVGQ